MKAPCLHWIALVFIASINHLTVEEAYPQAAPYSTPPNHQAILDQINALQTTVNTLQTTVSSVQTQLQTVQTQVQDVNNNVNATQSTIVRVLDFMTDLMLPAWSRSINAAQRFVLITGGAAVLDRETGLVWERSPTLRGGPIDAHIGCNRRIVGDRKGWRLPTVQELASLLDVTQSRPALPAGHPFTNVQLAPYWSATEKRDPGFSPEVWAVDFTNGALGGFNRLNLLRVWCVRGGQVSLDLQ